MNITHSGGASGRFSMLGARAAEMDRAAASTTFGPDALHAPAATPVGGRERFVGSSGACVPNRHESRAHAVRLAASIEGKRACAFTCGKMERLAATGDKRLSPSASAHAAFRAYRLRFDTPDGEAGRRPSDAVVLAHGGASWPRRSAPTRRGCRSSHSQGVDRAPLATREAAASTPTGSTYLAASCSPVKAGEVHGHFTDRRRRKSPQSTR